MNKYKKFFHGLRWNAFASVLYYCIFAAHSSFLFGATDHILYGTATIIFAFIYALIPLVTMGFDLSLAPFFSLCTKSKGLFKQIIIYQLLIQCCIIALIIVLLFIYTPFLLSFMPTAIVKNIPTDNYTLFLIGLLLFFETLRKIIRAIAQLAFLNKKNAFIELAMVSTYVGLVWLWYGIKGAMSLNTLLIPLLIASCLALIMLLRIIATLYHSLPHNTKRETPNNLYKRIIKSRIFAYGSQLGALLFSYNTLTLLFAFYGTLQTVALFNLINTITYSITAIIKKIFSIPTGALFASIKEQPITTKQHAFSLVTTQLHQIVYGIIIFFIINHKKIVSYDTLNSSITTWAIIILFLCINLIENIFMAYEMFYITEEQSGKLFALNGIMLIMLLSTIHYYAPLSFYHIMSLVIALRVALFIAIGIISTRLWQLKSTWHIKPWYATCSVIIALAFFLITS